MSPIIPILAVILLIAVVVSVLSGVKIVQPYEQAVYMRLGKYVRILNQGLFDRFPKRGLLHFLKTKVQILFLVTVRGQNGFATLPANFPEQMVRRVGGGAVTPGYGTGVDFDDAA